MAHRRPRWGLPTPDKLMSKADAGSVRDGDSSFAPCAFWKVWAHYGPGKRLCKGRFMVCGNCPELILGIEETKPAGHLGGSVVNQALDARFEGGAVGFEHTASTLVHQN